MITRRGPLGRGLLPLRAICSWKCLLLVHFGSIGGTRNILVHFGNTSRAVHVAFRPCSVLCPIPDHFHANSQKVRALSFRQFELYKLSLASILHLDKAPLLLKVYYPQFFALLLAFICSLTCLKKDHGTLKVGIIPLCPSSSRFLLFLPIECKL